MHFGNLDNYRIGDSIIRREAVWDLSQNCEKVEADDPVNNLSYGELTVPIKIKGEPELLWIESSIAPHVYLLNELGYKTLSCCAGHKECYLSSCDNKYISSGYIEVTYDAIKSIIEQIRGDVKKTSITIRNIVDLSYPHIISSVKAYEYDNRDCSGSTIGTQELTTGILEWNVGMDKDAYENSKSSADLSKSFEYALHQIRQWVFRHIILELKRIA